MAYEDVLRVWREADGIPSIEHAWLWDHLVPLFERLRLERMVTSNATRPPAVLAKIAATVDAISGGRLIFGIGVGGTRQPGDTIVAREYNAYGLPIVSPAEGVARLAEACTIFKRMWTEDVFDFDGRHYRLTGTICEPKPVQRPHPPIVIGGWGDKTLRVVAEHADIWNIPGPPHNGIDHIAERGRVLDEHCAAIGRDPHTITRSTQLIVSYDDPAQSRATVRQLIDIGVTHVVLNLLMPFPHGVAGWAAGQIIEPVLDQVPAR